MQCSPPILVQGECIVHRGPNTFACVICPPATIPVSPPIANKRLRQATKPWPDRVVGSGARGSQVSRSGRCAWCRSVLHSNVLNRPTTT